MIFCLSNRFFSSRTHTQKHVRSISKFHSMDSRGQCQSAYDNNVSSVHPDFLWEIEVEMILLYCSCEWRWFHSTQLIIWKHSWASDASSSCFSHQCESVRGFPMRYTWSSWYIICSCGHPILPWVYNIWYSRFSFRRSNSSFSNMQYFGKEAAPRPEDEKNTVTANGRNKVDSSGFSIQFSNISADHELQATLNTTSTYLGRPWKTYSRTVVIKSFISSAVRPEGWLEMDGHKFLGTLFHAEYKNYGPGADVRNRVKWPGYKILNDSSVAEMFSVSMFVKGDSWLPATRVTCYRVTVWTMSVELFPFSFKSY